jgi:hypothetical protein
VADAVTESIGGTDPWAAYQATPNRRNIPDEVTMTIWTDFCRALERAGALIDRPETPTDEIDRAEGYRYLTRLLRIGLDLAVEFGDPRRPELVPAQAKHFGDAGNTADCLYLHAVVDGNLRYRLHGLRGGAPFMEIGLYAGRIGFDPASRLLDALREDQLFVDAAGRIDVTIGGSERTTNTLRGDPTASYVFIRQYAHDWDHTEPAALTLELVDESPARGRIGVPLGVESIDQQLQRAARFVHDAGAAWARLVDNTRKGPPNVIKPVAETEDLTLPSGHRFAFGHFDLADDEALLIEFHPADVPYWGLTINNYWFEVLDYGEHGSHVNNHTVCYEPDGGVRVAISSRRPGSVSNWIDTRGHRVGEVVFRWSRTDLPLPELSTAVVPMTADHPERVKDASPS